LVAGAPWGNLTDLRGVCDVKERSEEHSPRSAPGDCRCPEGACLQSVAPDVDSHPEGRGSSREVGVTYAVVGNVVLVGTS
jgi:hypothetical protein